MSSPSDNAKVDIQMHTQVDMHGIPDGYLGSAGRGPLLFFGYEEKNIFFVKRYFLFSLNKEVLNRMGHSKL